ncbi:MAG: hypothetical protein ACYDGY_04125 [Acidimicrobiales bacterium]
MMRVNRYQRQGRARDMREMHNAVHRNAVDRNAVDCNTVVHVAKGRDTVGPNAMGFKIIDRNAIDSNTEYNDIEEAI